MQLPVVTSCDHCGACCMQQSSPPGYLYVLAMTGEDYADSPFAEDAERIKTLPPEAMEVLLQYRQRLMAGAFQDIGEVPCCWLDVKTRRCRWYEHRPSVCREDLQVGDAGCLAWREEYIDGPGARNRLRQLLGAFKWRVQRHEAETVP